LSGVRSFMTILPAPGEEALLAPAVAPQTEEVANNLPAVARIGNILVF